MKTILIPTDFSAASLNAARYAADMALAIDAKLVLLHIYHLPVVYSEVPVAYTEEDMRLEAGKEIDGLKNELIGRTAGKTEIKTEVRKGNFFQELEEVCERTRPYAVVMGSQGTKAVERLVFGGHTVYAMKNLMWPLITVPAGATYSSVKKIGLACDFDHMIDSIPLDEIKALVNDFKASLYVLNTGKKEVFDSEIVFESGMLEQMLAPVKPHYNFIINRDTDEGIMDFVEKNNIDLLIIMPKRHGLLDKIMHKSHTKRLVLHCHVPVMAIH